MSLKQEVRNEIKRYILQHIEKDDVEIVKKATDAYGVSRTTINNYIKQFVSSGAVRANGDKSSGYSLVDTDSVFEYDTDRNLSEDRIFGSDIAPLLKNVSDKALEIWQYSFTEMMNNAIEHSQASRINVLVSQNILSTTIVITDNGIGIFRKILDYLENIEKSTDLSLDDAVGILFPGKFTTDSANHSGEGIFFSSRAADLFIIYSDGKIFSHDTLQDSLFDSSVRLLEKGTVVFMRLENNSARDLADVMNMFSDAERGFYRTTLPISHIFPGNGPVSRSEARRLGAAILRFDEVTLDFAGVKSIGQAFAHELFIVFRRKRPEARFTCENMSDSVRNMMLRVINTR